MIKAVLFDMDGVIVDTEPLHHKAYFQMFETYNIEMSEEQYQTFTGRSTINVCKNLVEHFKLSHAPEELKIAKQQNFKRIFHEDDDLHLIDGALELIQDYYHNGLTLILASSASHNTINSVFDRFNLNPYFKAKVSGADFEKSKPDPAIFIKAAELSGESIENCMVIEDSTNGIEAGKRAKIYCVGFRSPHSKNQHYDKADKVIDDFIEISFEKLQEEFSTIH